MRTGSHLSKVANVVHGFGTRDDNMAGLFAGYWPDRPIQHERHGTRIAIIEHPREDCGEADGMLTEKPGLLLAIATADCAPVLLARKDGKAVAALHVGWRGALDGIVQQFARLLEVREDSPADWLAEVGPTAGACCYQVSEQIVEQFRERYDIDRHLLAPSPGRFNLAGVVQWQLARAGFISPSTLPDCTMCCRENLHCPDESFAFHSYRRDRETRVPVIDVQWSVIVRQVAP
jgi:YfiH family protein